MKKFARFFALVLVAMMMLSILPAHAVVAGISGTGSNNSSSTSTSSGAHGFTIRPIDWDGATVGQFALPDTYTGYWNINCCDNSTCLGFPVRTQVTISSNEEDARMIYYYGEQFLERVYDSTGLSYMSEGTLDPQLAIIHKYYTDAAGYCDQIATSWAPEAVFYKEEDMSFYNGVLEARRNEFYNKVVPGMSDYGTTVDWTNIEGAQRVYTFDVGGQTYCICVMVEMGAYQYTLNGYGVTYKNIIWQVPCYYILWCPIESYQRIHDGDFQIFVENTSVNDEMKALNDKLTEEIAVNVISNMNMVVAASSAYMEAMTALTFSMVESNMSSSRTYTGSYSSDRFSDYMFDQNDYTLSDGSSVKVSTGYNYVWEGSNGTVYYGNSLSDAPGGATQLYPNR